MTEINNQAHREKWRAQADKIAAHLKGVSDWGEMVKVKTGIAFDDGVRTLTLEVPFIQRLSEEALGEFIFYAVLATADQEAAPQAPAVTGNAPTSAQEQEQPAAPAVSERCSVKDGEEQCQNQAAGGLRVNLYATQTIQRRYGRRVMLSLVFDLPVCLGCMSKITPSNLMTDEQWRAFSRVAQQRNSGVLADRSQTEIVLCKFDDPEYQALRAQIAKQQTKSQPGPAGPQQGAGDGS